MKHSDFISHIRLSDINLSDQTFCIFDAYSDPDRLARSIARAGLNNPVLLRQAGDRYIVVSGFNRVNAFACNNEPKIPAIVLDKDLNTVDCFIKAISAVSYQRDLSPSEQIRSILKLSKHLSAKDISEQSDVIFSRPLSLGFVSDLIDIAHLPDPAVELIQKGMLSTKAARKLTRILPENVPFILDLFSQVKASTNIQLEILLNLHEISKRDLVSIPDILLHPDLKSLLTDPDSEIKVRTNRIRSWLLENRYPHFYKTKKTAQANLAALKTDRYLKIDMDPYFEDPDLNFSFRAKNISEFKDRVAQLTDMIDNEKLNRLFFYED